MIILVPGIAMREDQGKLQIELEDSTKVEISPQAYQAIHKLITGRSDTISQLYEQPFLIKLTDLIQLDKKIHQVLGQYKKISCTQSVTINHWNDRKAELVSFDLYDVTNTNPTELVILKYNIIISPVDVDDSLNKPQSYIITMRFFSNIIIRERLQQELQNIPITLLNLPSAEIKIEYIDYLIAKNFLNTVDDCIKGFKVMAMSKTRKLAIKYATALCIILKYIMPFTVAFLLLIYSKKFILSYNPHIIGLSYLILWGFFSLFLTYRVGLFLSKKLDNKLFSLDKSSFINLNKGDENKLEESNENDKKIIKSISIEFGVSIVVSLLTSLITYFHF